MAKDGQWLGTTKPLANGTTGHRSGNGTSLGGSILNGIHFSRRSGCALADWLIKVDPN